MKIYFEDGKLREVNQLPVKNDFLVDASYGASSNINILDEFKQRETEDGESLIIYTNSIFAFSSWYAWNDKLKVPEIYIRAGEYMVFTRIDKLTNRELKEGHNLAKMYVGGEFDNGFIKITIADIIELLDKYHKKYELLNNKFIRLFSEDGSYTGLGISDDRKSICYEGKVIGGLYELEKRL